MKCPKCHSEAAKVPWHDVYLPAKDNIRPSHSLVSNLAKMALYTYKCAAKVQYKCTNSSCEHRWDEK